MLELFVTGKSKSYITAGLAATMQSLGYATAVYKPIQTGAIEKNGFIQAPDLAVVKFADPFIKTYSTYLFKSDLLPVLAAEKENTVIEKDKILSDYEQIKHECVITDGTFGLCTPLGENFSEQDLAKMLNLPVLLVVSPKESKVEDILCGINQAESLRGVIINEFSDDSSDMNVKSMPKLIEKYTDAKILGIMPELNQEELISNTLTGIDLESVFDISIAKLKM